MNTEKYYTPELSEFNSEFQFEVYNSKVRFFFEAPEGWHKAYVDYGVLGYLKNIYQLIFEKQIRVKYLDLEDIEKCEWRYKGLIDTKTDYFWSLNDKHSIIYNYETNKAVVTIRDDENKEDFTAFVGEIKNISELKRIMKMIKIG